MVVLMVLSLAPMGWLLASCGGEEKGTGGASLGGQDAAPGQTAMPYRNPSPEKLGEPPAATVSPMPPTDVVPPSGRQAGSASIDPATLTATMTAGETISQHVVATIPPAPPKGDVMIAFDLTGSMWEELANVKANSVNIMNAVRGLIPDSYFGAISHMDYNGWFTGCGYADWYGDGPDYPYALNQALTSSIGDASAKIAALPNGYGDDWAEDYNRIFYESYSDPSIGWRSGAKKILLHWLDAMPHDCDYWLSGGGGCGSGVMSSTGPDPGRDNTVGTGDDIVLSNALAGMAANNISLIALYSGGEAWPEYVNLSLWQCYAARTGGRAIAINENGTIPGGTDIASFVAQLIGVEVSQIDKLTLEVDQPA